MMVLIACGGSGGHIFPGVALAREIIARKNCGVLIVCSDKPVDAAILRKSGYPFVSMRRNPYVPSGNPLTLAAFLLRLASGVFAGVRLLASRKPACVVGFGGFVSAPLILSAWLMRVPRVVHEQNVVPGLANRMTAVFADKIAVSFDRTSGFFRSGRVVRTGNPVRGGFISHDKPRARQLLGLDAAKFTVLITGGSQGAGAINRAAPEAFASIGEDARKGFQAFHLAGEPDRGDVEEAYGRTGVTARVRGFIDDMDKAYSAADLVVSRAGATTIAELAHFGKPSILVPYPGKGVHQHENALEVSERGAAVILDEKELTPGVLGRAILDCARSPERLAGMAAASRKLTRPDAALLLLDEITALAGRRDAEG